MSRQKESVNPITVIIIIVSILMIGSMVRNALSLYQARNRLDTAKQAVNLLEAEKQKMTEQIAIQTDPAALDQAIRNKLNLVQPGETIIIIASSNSATLSATPRPNNTSSSPSVLLKWWQILNPPKQ